MSFNFYGEAKASPELLINWSLAVRRTAVLFAFGEWYCFAVLFACGEWYCFAVIFVCDEWYLLRKLRWRIEYH